MAFKPLVNTTCLCDVRYSRGRCDGNWDCVSQSNFQYYLARGQIPVSQFPRAGFQGNTLVSTVGRAHKYGMFCTRASLVTNSTLAIRMQAQFQAAALYFFRELERVRAAADNASQGDVRIECQIS